jgi:hypothetical protein
MVIDTIRFSENSNIILACHITSVYDVNRNTTLEDDNYELVQAWATSITERNLQGIIFHNNFSQETCDTYTNDSISFVKIAYNPRFNPNVYRYFVYKVFLQQYLQLFKHIFITDVSDVVVVNNPFIDAYFLDNPSTIFCGDEPKKLNDSWMLAHSSHLREKISDFAAYESQFADDTLLNCGIIGGNAPLVFQFIEKLCAIHQYANIDNKTAYTGDMGAFNYLVRTQYNHQLVHGAPVNTVFKGYENDREDCWFRHK